jgi:hypothetical protein
MSGGEDANPNRLETGHRARTCALIITIAFGVRPLPCPNLKRLVSGDF